MRKLLLSAASATLGLSLFAAGASAQTFGTTNIPVTNNSFEYNTSLTDQSINCCNANTTIVGWQFNTGTSASGTQNQATTGKDGAQWAFINVDSGLATAAEPGVGTITTTVSPTTIQQNTTYFLNALYGNNGETGGYGQPGIDGLRLLAGSTVIASNTTDESASGNNNFYTAPTLTYTSGANGVDPNVGQPLNIQLTGSAAVAGQTYQNLYDNVNLSSSPAAVPEPAVGGLLFIGSLAALKLRGRKA